MTGTEPRAPLISCRWARGQSRRGPVHAQLDPSWAFEDIQCRCGEPLGNGEAVQVLALGPYIYDQAARRAHEKGEEHDAAALVLHHRCVTADLIRRIDVSAGVDQVPREDVEAELALRGVDTRFAPAAQKVARLIGMDVGDVAADLGTALMLITEIERADATAAELRALTEPMRAALRKLYLGRLCTPPKRYVIGSTANRVTNIGEVILANTAYALRDRHFISIAPHGECALTDTGLRVAGELHKQWLTDNPPPQLSPPKRGHLRIVTDDYDARSPQPGEGHHP